LTTRDEICEVLNNPEFNGIDFMVGTGISGAIVLAPVSIELNIPYGIIRKKIDRKTLVRHGGTHSNTNIETCIKTEKINQYVIIDDTIDSGDTVNRIVELMDGEYEHSKCIGIILYQQWPGMIKHNDINVTCLGERIRNLAKED
jgi:adenine/guanine phosphoribosyltransferase-like PRPP-binding protein